MNKLYDFFKNESDRQDSERRILFASLDDLQTYNLCEDYMHLAEMLPSDCKEQCSASGDQYNTCAEWVEILGLNIPREKCISELKDFGTWDDDELEDDSDIELNIKYLWISAGYEL